MNTSPDPIPLITIDDIPVSQAAGQSQSIDDEAILQNLGGAIHYSIQSIVLRNNPHHLSGTVRLYLYEDDAKARRFYQRLTKQIEARPFEGAGNEGLIRTTPHLLAFPDSTITSIRFRRGRTIVEIIGSFQPDPSFSQGYLTESDVIKHAQRLDQRIIENLFSPE